MASTNEKSRFMFDVGGFFQRLVLHAILLIMNIENPIQPGRNGYTELTSQDGKILTSAAKKLKRMPISSNGYLNQILLLYKLLPWTSWKNEVRREFMKDTRSVWIFVNAVMKKKFDERMKVIQNHLGDIIAKNEE